MADKRSINIAVVDYGLGNLFSIKHACNYSGMDAIVTNDKKIIINSDAVILPGVGAFGDAMNALSKLDLISPIKDFASSGNPLIGICLGLQLLFTESQEFGINKGLDIINGEVIHLNQNGDNKKLKVPLVGWNQIFSGDDNNPTNWENTFLSGLNNYTYMYFVHSFCVRPENDDDILAYSNFGITKFCSCIQKENIFACQFHPERSGIDGLSVYNNIFAQLKIKIENQEGSNE